MASGRRRDERRDSEQWFGSDESRPTVSRDTTFELLQNSRRRYVLSAVRADGPTELSTLAREICAREDGIAPAEVDATAQKRVYVSLYQSHVPKLEAAGVVTYDESERTVAATPAAADVDRYLGPTPAATDWGRVAGAVSVLTGVLFVGYLLPLPALRAVPVAALGAAVVVPMLALALAQHADHKRRVSARPPELREL